MIPPEALFTIGMVLLAIASAAIVAKYDEWRIEHEYKATHLNVEELEKIQRMAELMAEYAKTAINLRWMMADIQIGLHGYRRVARIEINGDLNPRTHDIRLDGRTDATEKTEDALREELEETTSLLNREISIFLGWCMKNVRKTNTAWAFVDEDGEEV